MIKIFFLLVALSCSHEPVAKKYLRKDWAHWSDKDKNCLNTRQEILKSRSTVPVVMNKKGCKVLQGQWMDYYYPESHTDPKKVDIDHLIPLKNASISGGLAWSKSQKEAFANDPENLVITNLSYNRKKGAKGIDGWLPVHKDFACRYIKDWVKIKKKYKLRVLRAELNTIKISKCP